MYVLPLQGVYFTIPYIFPKALLWVNVNPTYQAP
jgi:hypothetical protein